jgi:high-affinity Fe2+/Pb2+ permease
MFIGWLIAAAIRDDAQAKEKRGVRIGAGMGLGLTLGIVLGVAVDNIALGLVIGIIIGALGVAARQRIAKDQAAKRSSSSH